MLTELEHCSSQQACGWREQRDEDGDGGREKESGERNVTQTGEKKGGGRRKTEMHILPIWTLGDPHRAPRHRSVVTTNSSFMVCSGSTSRRQRVPTRTSSRRHSSFVQLASRALRMLRPLLLRCACRYCRCCCCWAECARRGSLRNTDEARGRTESSRQLKTGGNL